MTRKIRAALAALIFGTTLLSGCFVVPPWWWEPDHGGRWEGRHHGRHGALTPQDQQRNQDDLSRKRTEGNGNG